MTIATPHAAHSPSRATGIRWLAVQRGLWVGTRDGEFAGMIESVWGEGFTATTAHAKALGSFATFELAKASFGR